MAASRSVESFAVFYRDRPALTLRWNTPRHTTRTTRPAAMRSSSSGVRRKTVWGCPPAAQIASHARRSSSTSVVSGAGCPSGATPPMAKPVCARTKSASARPMASPSSAPSFASSTRLAPLVSTSSGRPLSRRRNTSDFTICPTSQPTAAAASADVRAACSRTTIVVATPAAASASATRRALAGSSATRGDDGAGVAHLGEVLEVVVGFVRDVLRERERPEVAGEAWTLGGAGRQRGQVGQRLGARAAERREVVVESALATVALPAPGDRIEGLEARALLRRHEPEARQEEPTLQLHEMREHLLHRPLVRLRTLAERPRVEPGGQLGHAVGDLRERAEQLGQRQRDARLAPLRRHPERRAHILDLSQVLGVVRVHRRRVRRHREGAATRADALAAPPGVVQPAEQLHRLAARVGERAEQRRRGRESRHRQLTLGHRGPRRAGSNSSTGLPAGSSSRICLPPLPTTISFRNRTPATRSFSTSRLRSSTSSWMRFQPPGSGLRPSGIAWPAPPPPPGVLSSRRSAPCESIAKPGPGWTSTWNPSW